MLYLIKFLISMSHYNSNKSIRVSQIYGSNGDWTFALKALMIEKPFTIEFSALFISLMYLGYTLRIIEF